MLTLAILGSTKGTTAQAIIDAIEQGELEARVEMVISNKQDAYILERAQKHSIPSMWIDTENKSREEFDREVSSMFEELEIDLILLIGYMRLLSKPFVEQWKNKIINVHPSLLPAFAGGMDMDVHQAVIDAKSKETGCTIHYVDEGTDTGKILLQKKCSVDPSDTAESLKTKVQKLEGEAFLEVLNKLTL
jgi:phosphoribosylglycinamide formyltransferase 1